MNVGCGTRRSRKKASKEKPHVQGPPTPGRTTPRHGRRAGVVGGPQRRPPSPLPPLLLKVILEPWVLSVVPGTQGSLDKWTWCPSQLLLGAARPLGLPGCQSPPGESSEALGLGWCGDSGRPSDRTAPSPAHTLPSQRRRRPGDPLHKRWGGETPGRLEAGGWRAAPQGPGPPLLASPPVPSALCPSQ